MLVVTALLLSAGEWLKQNLRICSSTKLSCGKGS